MKSLWMFRVDAPHFCAAGLVEDGKVLDVAPILAYMNGWTGKKVREYCGKKDWKLEYWSIPSIPSEGD